MPHSVPNLVSFITLYLLYALDMSVLLMGFQMIFNVNEKIVTLGDSFMVLLAKQDWHSLSHCFLYRYFIEKNWQPAYLSLPTHFLNSLEELVAHTFLKCYFSTVACHLETTALDLFLGANIIQQLKRKCYLACTVWRSNIFSWTLMLSVCVSVHINKSMYF